MKDNKQKTSQSGEDKVLELEQDLKKGNKVKLESLAEANTVFYTSVNYLQMSDDTQFFDRLQENNDYECLLQEAKEYDSGNSIDMENTYKSPTKYPGDDVLVEDEHYVVIYNNSVGGTYNIMRKVSEHSVREAIDRYGLPDYPSEDVKEVAKGMVAKQFTKMANRRMPVFEMENGAVLYVEYNRDSNNLDVGVITNTGLAIKHSFAYEHNASLEANLQWVQERLSEMAEYEKEQEEEVSVARSGFRR